MASNSNHPIEVTLPSEANPPAPDPTSYVETNEYVQALIRWAAENGHAGVMKELLDQGHWIRYFHWKTPQHLAVQNGHLRVTELLIRRGASVDCTDYCYYRTALSFAAENGDEAMVRLLLSLGAEVDAKSYI